MRGGVLKSKKTNIKILTVKTQWAKINVELNLQAPKQYDTFLVYSTNRLFLSSHYEIKRYIETRSMYFSLQYLNKAFT